MRQDLQLTCYAVALGYFPRIRSGPLDPADFIDGIPPDELSFEKESPVHDLRVSVWRTARGWRAALLQRQDDGGYRFDGPHDRQFHRKLKAALDYGHSLFIDAIVRASKSAYAAPPLKEGAA